ncbi:MAG TPA: AMP-binding protein [Thermodesulfobacteriota bacterium]
MLVDDFLARSAERFPEKVALVADGRRLTYAELDLAADRFARGLRARGLERGDRVAVYLENTPEAVVALFGALRADGVFMVINPTTKPDKLAFILDDAEARVLVTDGPKLEAARERLASVPGLSAVVVTGPVGSSLDGLPVTSFEELIESAQGRGSPVRRSIDIDLAALIYTSGSTGSPKGVMMTHLNIVTAARSITTYLRNTPDDVILNVLPLSFDYGLYQVLMAFLVGATVVLERGFAYPRVLIQRLIDERVTGLPIVPTISAILLKMDLGRYHLPALRYITNTAAAWPTRHILELRRAFPQAELFSMYGLTECKRVSYLPPSELDTRPDSVGIPIPNTEAYVVDEAGSRVPPGTVGELVVRGAHVMKGYWRRPAETEAALAPGPLPGERVLRTGDLFRTDADGYLYFVGRKDDIIKTRGEKVSPREVENVLHDLDGISEAAVIGVPDPVLGERIKAVVTLKDGARLTERDIQRHCRARLEDFMVPQVIEIRESLPRTSTGKVDKRELRAAAGRP